ncbi:aminoglycoside phosphotransferase family protein [Paenibacillus sp. 481]|nr:aminoglycoside phosphotransferase family protein [Paenibacillus sp. 481]
MKTSVPFLEECEDWRRIEKGYSDDEKYIVTHAESKQKALLKLFKISDYTAKQTEYEILYHMKQLDVKCSRPLDFGKLHNVDKGYMLLTYIEGDDASDELPNCSEEEQYRIGLEAGEQLRKMHQLHAPIHLSSWYDRFYPKQKHYIETYKACGVRLEHDSRLISFIEAHLPLAKQRPNLFQHDDFHVGNLVIQDRKLAGVIDFNRFDWGDPIHEFLKVGMFSSEVSIPFSKGQIAAYHQHQEPDESFWKLYSLYLAMCMFSSVVWILKVKPDELSQMVDKVNRVLDDHDYFTSIQPSWYNK